MHGIPQVLLEHTPNRCHAGKLRVASGEHYSLAGRDGEETWRVACIRVPGAASRAVRWLMHMFVSQSFASRVLAAELPSRRLVGHSFSSCRGSHKRLTRASGGFME